MASLKTLSALFFSVFLTPLFAFLSAILVCASVTKSFGIRKAYVNFLLKVFEFGRNTIERKHKTRENSVIDEDEKEKEKPKVIISLGDPKEEQKGDVNHVKENNKLENGQAMLISREDLILAPDPELNYVGNNNLEIGKTLLPRSRSYETLRREFQLSDCLDYIKAGVEAIIEDQVTSRFEAEELKVKLNCVYFIKRHLNGALRGTFVRFC